MLHLQHPNPPAESQGRPAFREAAPLFHVEHSLDRISVPRPKPAGILGPTQRNRSCTRPSPRQMADAPAGSTAPARQNEGRPALREAASLFHVEHPFHRGSVWRPNPAAITLPLPETGPATGATRLNADAPPEAPIIHPPSPSLHCPLKAAPLFHVEHRIDPDIPLLPQPLPSAPGPSLTQPTPLRR